MKTGLIYIAVAILIEVALAWSFMGRPVPEYLLRRPFDAASWKDHKLLSDDTRRRMVVDLLRSHSFRGMTRDQVITIIGEPDQPGVLVGWHMAYYLGPPRGFGEIDAEWLIFRLNSQSYVIDYRIATG